MDSYLGLIFILAWMYSTSELDELLQILNSVKGFKLDNHIGATQHKVVYKKGKDIPVADALSCVSPMDPEDNIQLPIIAVNMITTHILIPG